MSANKYVARRLKYIRDTIILNSSIVSIRLSCEINIYTLHTSSICVLSQSLCLAAAAAAAVVTVIAADQPRHCIAGVRPLQSTVHQNTDKNNTHIYLYIYMY